MVEQLSVLGGLPDDLRLVPNPCNFTSGALTLSSGLHSHCHTSLSPVFSHPRPLCLPKLLLGFLGTLRPDLLTLFISVVFCS